MPDYYTNYPRTLLWLVQGGTVTIGGPEEDATPRFETDIEPFYISKFPITNRQFEAFEPDYARSEVSNGDDDPAVGVTFNEAQDYARWYASVSRKKMRLPTEVEWEYACRAGSTGRYYFGDDPAEAGRYLWDRRNSRGRLQPLREKEPNDFGLYGMLGGIWEWTLSDYRPYPLDPSDVADPKALKVIRGGSFLVDREEFSCSKRRAADPAVRFNDVGFRIARSLRGG